jgi:hypothetical protein
MNKLDKRTFQEVWDEVTDKLRNNLTRKEYDELISLEYVLTHGYSDDDSYEERYKYLSKKR